MDDALRWDLGPAEAADLYFDWERLRDGALTPAAAPTPVTGPPARFCGSML